MLNLIHAQTQAGETMKKGVLWWLEKFLVFICRASLYFIQALGWLIDLAGKIITFLLFLAAFALLLSSIGALPAFWQSLVLQCLIIAGAIFFLLVVALRIWKPKKFFEVFDQLKQNP